MKMDWEQTADSRQQTAGNRDSRQQTTMAKLPLAAERCTAVLPSVSLMLASAARW
jgi:hypothetical protein